MNEWYQALTAIEKVYWVIAVAATILFVIQMISVFVLGDLDVQVAGDTDFDIEADSGMPYQFFTFRNLVGFFTVFAWSGLASIAADYVVTTTLIISSISGLVMMGVMSILFYFISRMADSGTMHYKNAIGKVATTYLPIKAKRGNMGKVQIEIQSSFHELDAMTDEEEDIPTNSIVEVVDLISGNILLVKRNK